MFLERMLLICFVKASRALCAAAGSLCPALQSAAGNGASFIAAESRPCSHCSTCRQYTAHSVPAPSVPSAQRISNTAFRTSSCRNRSLLTRAASRTALSRSRAASAFLALILASNIAHSERAAAALAALSSCCISDLYWGHPSRVFSWRWTSPQLTTCARRQLRRR